MDWTRDPRVRDEAEPQWSRPPAGPRGYLVRNDFDWPVWIGGSLSLEDVLDIASGTRLEFDR
ncbi:hypothetical protein [Actinokineospora cianjurensis]|uniref:Uncharacterized protein n=1 Tax=Actinokineospora cianjurensis TaxID=585224 RepID=A0A421AZT5_9PSEU|nr:hypothetical protein [Actinokineospora cianjurensis]RLK55319.1 hypothetical protein CLV68_4804 [Actinokineospora cianjurensis]